MLRKATNRLMAVLLTAVTISATSCSDDFGEKTSRGETTITAFTGETGPESRTAIDETEYIGGETGILWTSRDTLGVFCDKDSNVPFTNSLTAPQGRAQFKGIMTGTPRYAYFPYSRTAGTDVTSLKGTLYAEQLYDAATRYISGDYKYGTPRNGAQDEFDFTHIFCLLRFAVEAGNTALAGEELSAITVTAPSGRVISGDFTFNATDGTYTMSGGEGSDKAGVKFAKATQLAAGSTVTAYASCAPAIKTGDVLTVTLSTADHIATFNAKAVCDFEANRIYTLDLKLDKFCNEEHGWILKTTPSFKSFEFTVAANTGKILDKKVQQTAEEKWSIAESTVTSEPLEINGHEISGMIPYLYDFTLVPTFTVSEGTTVKVGGAEQVSAQTSQDFSKPVTYTLEAADGSTSEYTVSVKNTGLPVVVMEQSSTNAEGKWKNWFGALKVREKETTWAEDDYMTIYNPDGSVDMARNACGMRLRGNSTQSMPKQPFAIKLVKKQPVLGMPKHKRWVLLANWMDYSMIRNHAAFVIAHAVEKAWKSGAVPEGIKWNPSGINVELVVDGRHVGNYYLCEQIKIDKDRLNIKDCYEDVLKDTGSATFENCGYLMECDLGYDENCKFMTSKRYLPFMFKDDVPDNILNSVKSKVDGIDKNLASGKYAEAYNDLDIYSVIDQWIINEVAMNEEFRHPKSVYMYMDGGNSKLCAGPIWDYDWQTFPNADAIKALNSNPGGSPSAYSPKNIQGDWLYKDSKFDALIHTALGPQAKDQAFMWYPVLFKDATFRAAVQERWEAVYPQLQAVAGELMPLVDKNKASWEVNRKMWPSLFKRGSDMSTCFNGDEAMETYEEVVANLIYYYQVRLDWMNTQIKAGNFVTNAK